MWYIFRLILTSCSSARLRIRTSKRWRAARYTLTMSPWLSCFAMRRVELGCVPICFASFTADFTRVNCLKTTNGRGFQTAHSLGLNLDLVCCGRRDPTELGNPIPSSEFGCFARLGSIQKRKTYGKGRFTCGL